MRTDRLFEIVFILLNQKQSTAKELAEKFDVSVRTIYRDIDVLSYAGIPVYTAQGTGGGIFIDERYTINKSILTKEEQEQIVLALQCLSPIDEMHTESILNRLSAVFQKNTDWVHVDYSRWENKTDNHIFKTIKQAVLECRAIGVEYLSSYGEKTERTIYPLRLLFKSKAWHLESYCTVKKEFRLFRLNRILSVKKSLTTFNRADMLKKIPCAANVLQHQSLTRIKLKCSTQTAYRLYDEFPPEYITKNKDGSYTLSGCLPLDAWVYNFVLSLGTDAEILEPAQLKKDIIEFAEGIIKHYKKD
ncbi:MAG: YafY family protein [Treponema pedis]|uniref:helix-turn-helix transcriptional regulator n=1 Tax=Treponema pedis TaxID=409322 RepID=UPI00313411B8